MKGMDSSTVAFKRALEKIGPQPNQQKYKEVIQTYTSLYLPYCYSKVDGCLGGYYKDREKKALGSLYEDIYQ